MYGQHYPVQPIPSVADSTAQRLGRVRERIRAAASAAGRDPASVHLLAVSKTVPVAKIWEAIRAGQRVFGENYLQEALEKIDALARQPIEWHYIGRVQGNKTRAIAEHFAWLHSLTDARHARRLSDQRPAGLPPLNVCIQVNVSGEASKGGVEPGAVAALLDSCRGLPRLRVRGLMAIPAPAADPQAQRVPLRLLRELRDRLQQPEQPLDTLSMGMSGDLEAAIAEGATWVRVGTAIFGPRDYGQH
jgi:pyridoxal phosphate enzyme (YggS family)